MSFTIVSGHSMSGKTWQTLRLVKSVGRKCESIHVFLDSGAEIAHYDTLCTIHRRDGDNDATIDRELESIWFSQLCGSYPPPTMVIIEEFHLDHLISKPWFSDMLQTGRHRGLYLIITTQLFKSLRRSFRLGANTYIFTDSETAQIALNDLGKRKDEIERALDTVPRRSDGSWELHEVLKL